MSINWNNHIDRLRSQISDLRNTLRVIKTKAHDERPGLEQTTAQLRELVDKDESQKTLYQFPKILHKILHNPAVGAIILGPNGEHLLFNTAAERLLGSDLMADALAEKSGNFGFYLTDKVTKYSKEQLPWQQAVEGKQVPEVDLFVRRQGYVDGLWIKATSTALKSESNDIGGAVVFLVDITEQVQVENQIQSTCEALEQQIAQIGSAQLELQLLTEKLGKLDYLPETAPDAVQSGGSNSGASAANKATKFKTESASKPTQNSEGVEEVAAPNLSGTTQDSLGSENGSEKNNFRVEALDTEGDRVTEAKAETAATTFDGKDDDEFIDDDRSAEDESEVTAANSNAPSDRTEHDEQPSQVNATQLNHPGGEPADIKGRAAADDAQAESETSEATTESESNDAQMHAEEHTPNESGTMATHSQPDTMDAQSQAEMDALSAEIDEALTDLDVEAAETLDRKAQAINEQIVSQLTTEILAIANQPALDVEAEAKPAQQEFFAPDASEKLAMTVAAVSTVEKPGKASKKTETSGDSGDAAGRRRKILIVDDIPVNQKLLRLQLKRLGFECEAANNGDAAQKAIANGDFALVLMDLDMPIMDGFESTSAIRKNEQGLGKRIPIVAMTSYDRQEDREKCLAVGMDDFLSKGATQKQLNEVVQRCINTASSSTENKGIPPASQSASQVSQANVGKETGLDIESLQKQFDKEEVQDVSRLFLSAVNTFIDCIQLGIEEKDAGAVTHFAHSVKGPCAALGIDEMTRLTSEIMSDAEAGNWTQVRVKYMKLKSSFGEVRDQLRELCTPGYV